VLLRVVGLLQLLESIVRRILDSAFQARFLTTTQTKLLEKRSCPLAILGMPFAITTVYPGRMVILGQFQTYFAFVHTIGPLPWPFPCLDMVKEGHITFLEERVSRCSDVPLTTDVLNKGCM
jgi:hypothetical protein